MTVRQHSRSSELYQIYSYVATAAMSGVSAPVSIGFSLELTALRLVSNRNVSVSAGVSVRWFWKPVSVYYCPVVLEKPD